MRCDAIRRNIPGKWRSPYRHFWHENQGEASTPAYCTVIVSMPDWFCAEAPLSEITLPDVMV
jgi:hypothetical protein